MVSYNQNKINFYIRFFISFLFVSIVYLCVLNSKGIYNSEFVYLTNAFIIIYSIINILLNRFSSYSARNFFYLFIFFFMGIAPIMQYKQGTQTIGGYDISEKYYIITNLIVSICLIIFDVSYRLSFKSIRNTNTFYSEYCHYTHKDPLKYRYALLILASISLIITLFEFRQRPLLLLFRGLEMTNSDIQSSGNSQFWDPLYNCIIRPLPIICCINYLCIGKNKTTKIILFIISLLSCFPTSLARLRVAAYYIPMLIIIFPKVRYKNLFVNIFILGFLFLFPLLNNFRTWGETKFKWFNLDFNMFCNMNYDSYQSLAFVLQNDIITYGRQLLVVFFFWIPRSYWPDKPLFSGMTVAHDYGLWFDQISMNYFAEGYLNFGMFGIILFVIILAYVTARFDKRYWIFNKGNEHSLYAPFYFLFIGMYFFFMRGDLMYGFEYTICLLFANWILYKISYKLLSVK